jgi:predicted nucleotidyltransferase
MRAGAFAHPVPSTGSLKLALRRLVLSTSVPPLNGIYHGVYKALIARCVRLFRRYDGLQAIYLMRGAAKGELMPGVSDLDFTLIGNFSPADTADLRKKYLRLAKITGLLDPNIEIFTRDSLNHLFRTNTYWQYRLTEAQSTWRLLWGSDFVAELKPLTPAELRPGLFTEIKVWWALFARRLFVSNKVSVDAVAQRSLCFKTASEILKMDLALRHDRLTFSRNEALKFAKPHLDQKGRALAECLETARDARYLSGDESLLEETKNFLVRYLESFFTTFDQHPLARPIVALPQAVDLEKSEWFDTAEESLHVNRIIDHVRSQWAGTYHGAHLAASAFFNVDDLLLMIAIDPTRPPTIEQLRDLTALHWRHQPGLRRRVHLFLLLPHVALQIDTAEAVKSWQSILSPANNPDVFALLSSGQAHLDGAAFCPLPPGGWTPLAEQFFREEEALFYGQLDDPAVFKANLLDFLRLFWKTAQLVAVNRSVRAGSVLYPLTPAATARALEAHGAALPENLKPLIAGYSLEAAGKDCGAARLVPAAVAYLKEIKS